MKPSGFESMVEQQRKWYLLRKTEEVQGKDASGTMYLMTSFNHWFPIKMQTKMAIHLKGPHKEAQHNQ